MAYSGNSHQAFGWFRHAQRSTPCLASSLDAEAPLTGMVRFVRWQIAIRFVPGAALAVPFTDRARLPVSVEDTERRQMANCGLNDFDMRLLLHYLREGDIFSALGANVGAYSVLASAAVGAQTMPLIRALPPSSYCPPALTSIASPIVSASSRTPWDALRATYPYRPAGRPQCITSAPKGPLA